MGNIKYRQRHFQAPSLSLGDNVCRDCTNCRIKLRVKKGRIKMPEISDPCICLKGLWARNDGAMVDKVIYKSVMNPKFRYNPNPSCPEFDGEI